jgi:hypothetical protein
MPVRVHLRKREMLVNGPGLGCLSVTPSATVLIKSMSSTFPINQHSDVPISQNISLAHASSTGFSRRTFLISEDASETADIHDAVFNLVQGGLVSTWQEF